MWFGFTGMILLFLHPGQPRENKNPQQKLDQVVASPGGNVQISCNIPPESHVTTITWYKEQRDKSLQRVYLSFSNSKPEGKYSGQRTNLTISNVQRNDSGVYYCTSSTYLESRTICGVRLIVTVLLDTSQPSLSVLQPSSLEGTELNHSVPVLCLMFDADPAWDNFTWDISEESSQDQKGVAVIDEEGIFSIWHLEMIPRKEWTEQKAYSTCLLQEKRGTSAENCNNYLYFGIPCIIVLLAAASILFFRKHLARGNAEQGANQIPAREIPQTNYAEVRYKTGNVACVDR